MTTFQISQLKISKELVRNIHTKKDDLFIIKAIIFLAQGIDMEVIAEGVDSLEQLETLKQFGCRIVQGNYYSQPLAADDFEKRYLSLASVESV